MVGPGAGNLVVLGSKAISLGAAYLGNNTDQIYSAFSFNNNGTTDYGWFSGTFSNTTYSGFAYTVDQVAYDNSGAMIATGQVPEPASAGLMMMGALAIGGAAAVRRWKAGKAVVNA